MPDMNQNGAALVCDPVEPMNGSVRGPDPGLFEVRTACARPERAGTAPDGAPWRSTFCDRRAGHANVESRSRTGLRAAVGAASPSAEMDIERSRIALAGYATALRIASSLAGIAVAIVVATYGYRAWARHPVAFDDAYITFRYAQNLVAGHGAVYNPGEHVEGYTNFSWMLLSAAGLWAGGDPLQVTRAAGLASHALMLALIGWFAARWLVGQGLACMALLPVLAVLVLPAGFAAMAGSGLETSFVALLLIASALLIYAGDFSRRGPRYALAAVLVVSVLTRLDALLSVGAVFVAIALSELRIASPRTALLRAAEVVAPVFVVLAVWSLWRRAYYGDWLPNTYYAKEADQFHLDAGLAYLKSFLHSHPQAIPLELLALTALTAPEPRLRRMAVFANLTLCAELLYIAKVGGDFMEFRFLWQLYGMVVLTAVAGLYTIATQSLPAALIVVACTLVIPAQPLQPDPYTMQSLDEMNGYRLLGEKVGRALGKVLPHETVISTTLAGTVAYFSKLRVVDQWGLNDRYVARLPTQHFLRGHVKFAPIAYLRKRGVNLYVAHPVVCSCRVPCRDSNPDVFVRLPEDRCLRTWYLTQTKRLTDYFCAHPGQFVLRQVACPAQPRHQ